MRHLDFHKEGGADGDQTAGVIAGVHVHVEDGREAGAEVQEGVAYTQIFLVRRPEHRFHSVAWRLTAAFAIGRLVAPQMKNALLQIAGLLQA